MPPTSAAECLQADTGERAASGPKHDNAQAQFPSTPTHPSLLIKPPSAPVSPSLPSKPSKRASKACASCRKDKTKCDGERPCSACLKKGYSPDQCVDGCENCRRARSRCEDGIPCLRCRNENLACGVENADLASPSNRKKTSSSLVVRRTRTRAGERAKLACRSCRRDNKKCEDRRPCSRCVSRAEQCIHVERGPKLVKLRCESCRQDNRRCQDFRPCEYCTTKGINCIDIPRKERGYASRVKAACINCRNDKVRCDGFRPCNQCSRKAIQCQDRACKGCLKAGLDCTHRGVSMRQLSSSEDEALVMSQVPSKTDVIQPSTPVASTSRLPPSLDSPPSTYPQHYYDFYNLSAAQQTSQHPMAGPGVTQPTGSDVATEPPYADNIAQLYYPMVYPSLSSTSYRDDRTFSTPDASSSQMGRGQTRDEDPTKSI